MNDQPLDSRRHAFRPDLADSRLEGRVEATRLVDGEQRRMAWPVAPLRARPDISAGLDTEVLYGERVTVFDVAHGWAWVQLDRDGYVGYVLADALSDDAGPATHRVKALGTFVYPVPDIKAPPIMLLSMNAELSVAEWGERFSRLATGGHVISRHITEITRHARDFAEIAERFIGTPYLWGGKTRLGIDCSGLVQVAAQAAGIAAPRDSDQQAAELGAAVLVPKDLDGLQRGDLVCWKGHIGIMIDSIMMVHANAHHMAVVAEPLVEAAARIAKTGSEITTIRRLPGLSA
jgi:cell wall-associated NlpC family hydrolase